MRHEIIKITPKDHEEWLKYRKQFVGGSEVAGIYGLNKWMSPYQVWEDKTGRAEPFADNSYTLAGKFLEDGIARYYEHETGNRVIKSSANDILYIDKLNRVGGTPDRTYFPKDSNRHKDKRILEIKTTSKIFDYDSIPLSFFLQPNFYCGLLGLKGFTIVWFEFHTLELKYADFDFDEELYESSVKAANAFWNTYVIPDTPPPAQSESDILKLFPESKENKVLVASNEVLDLYSKGIDLFRRKKEIEKNYKEVGLQIKLLMKDAERLITPSGETIFTFRSGARGRSLRIKEI